MSYDGLGINPRGPKSGLTLHDSAGTLAEYTKALYAGLRKHGATPIYDHLVQKFQTPVYIPAPPAPRPIYDGFYGKENTQ